MKKTFLLLIAVYQKGLSGMFRGQCRFLPTCSEYAKEAIDVNGPWRGSMRAIYRVLRCHRWACGGWDPA